jgi:hypothetical protein
MSGAGVSDEGDEAMSKNHGPFTDQHKLTPIEQHQPLPEVTEFLRGVQDEAIAQGYSRQSQGRIFVVALRFWERR